MADRVRIGSFDSNNRFVTELDVNDGSTYKFLRDTLRFIPPESQQAVSQIERRYGGGWVAGETHGNGGIEAEWYVKGTTKADTQDKAENLLAALAKQGPGRYLEFRPDGSQFSVYYELRGPGQSEVLWRWIEWQGTDSIHLKGAWQVAPLAYGDYLDFVDDFSTNTIADYTQEAGAWSISSGRLVPPLGTSRIYHTSRGYLYSDVQVTARLVYNGPAPATDTVIGVIIRGLDPTNRLYSRLLISAAAADSIRAVKVDNGASTALTPLVNLAADPAVGNTIWLRSRITGNDVTTEYFTSQPTPNAAPTATATTTLSGADATKFGAGVVGKVGLLFESTETAGEWQVEDFIVEPYTYRLQTLPTKIRLPKVPGTAPAAADLYVTQSGANQAWALLAWGTPLSGSGTPPLSIIEAESGTNLTTWASSADATARGGNRLSWTTSGAATATADYLINPELLPADDFTQGDLRVEVWARMRIQSTVVSPKVTLSARPSDGAAFGLDRYTQEYGTAGKLLTVPSSSTQWRLVRLGTLTLPAKESQWHLRVTASVSAGSSGVLGMDYLILVPARQRMAGASGRPNDATYPDFYIGTSEATRIQRANGTGAIQKPNGAVYPAASLGGQLPELPPGDVDLLVTTSNTVPDDPTIDTSSDDLGPTATIHARIRPRYFLSRGS